MANPPMIAYFHPGVVDDTPAAPLFWTTAEISIGVFAACLPPLSPLLRQIPNRRKTYSSIRSVAWNRLWRSRDDYGLEKLDDPEHKYKNGKKEDWDISPGPDMHRAPGSV